MSLYSKSRYSAFLTEPSQWNYKFDSVKVYKPTIQNQIFIYHQQQKTSKLKLFNTLHHNHLDEKFSKLDIHRSRNRIFLTHNDNDKDSLQTETKTISYNDKKKKEIQSQIENPFPYTFDHFLSDSINTIPLNETSTQFLNKTKAMIRAKQIRLYQNEKLKQIKEGTESQLQELNTQKFNLRKDKGLLLYLNKTQSKYLSFLYKKLEEEKRELALLKEQRYEIDNSIRQFNNKILKVNHMLQNSKQYKVFLLLVKYKVKSIDVIPQSELKQYGISQASVRECVFKRNSIKLMKRSSIARELANISSLIKNNNNITNSPLPLTQTINFSTNATTTQSIPRKNRRSSLVLKDLPSKASIPSQENLEPHNPPIFASPDEFIEHFKTLEEGTQNLFLTFNEMTYDSNELYKERNKYKLIINQDDLEDQRIEDSLNKELAKVKETHQFLSSKYSHSKQLLDNCPSVRVLFKKIKLSLLNLPFEIDVLIDLPLFYSYMLEPSEVIFISGKKENKVVYAIKALEKILFFFISKLNEYKSNSKYMIQLRKVTFALENIKRYEKSKQNQLIEIQRREIVHQKIYEKYNKIAFIPKRKINKKYEFKNSRNMQKKRRESNESNFNLEALLTY